MENRGKTMMRDEFEFGFAVDWMRKDLGIVIQEAERIGAPLQITQLVDAFYAEVQTKGGGRLDTSSLITRLRPVP
jgi:3-hydroxyisobutyrate dehydrogenase-like beta-hydroxyacid dehydrogenase